MPLAQPYFVLEGELETNRCCGICSRQKYRTLEFREIMHLVRPTRASIKRGNALEGALDEGAAWWGLG